MSETDKTRAKQLDPFKWRPGQSGNPAGRPKSARSKIAEDFLRDVQTEWESHGAVAISDMREKNPGDFVKMVASLLPKEMTLNINSEAEMSDDELRDRIRSLADQLAPFLGGAGGVGEGVEAQAGAPVASRVH